MSVFYRAGSSPFKELLSVLRLYPFYILVLESPLIDKITVMLDGKCFKNCTYSKIKLAVHVHPLLLFWNFATR